MKNEQKKKVIIIGAGISGMTAAIYALDNGYDVTVYEKHNIPGGECTGWTRNGVYIDGCAHYIIGTNPKSELYPLWKHIGAFNDKSLIHESEYYAKFDVHGEIVTIYSNLNKLKEELLRVAPEDKRHINRLIRGIKAYTHVRVPVSKPIDYMNLFELTKFGLNFIPMLFHYLRYTKISLGFYARKFKSPIIKEIFSTIMEQEYNYHCFAYVMQAFSQNNAGIVAGGSKYMAQNIANTVVENGGKIIYNSPVKRIVVENNVAVGVQFGNGIIEKADYVVCSVDAHHAMYDLLEGKYKDPYYDSRFSNREKYPLNTSFFLAFKVKKDLSSYPKMMNIPIHKTDLTGRVITRISIRNYAFDKTLEKEKNTTALSVLIPAGNGIYDKLRAMNKTQYKKYKEDLGLYVKKHVCRYYGIAEKDIDLLDVASPLTYERYTNAYHGSYMSFISTVYAKGLMRKGVIKGLKHFVLAGQWIMQPGGLPIALFTGKHAVMRICREDKKLFVNKD